MLLLAAVVVAQILRIIPVAPLWTLTLDDGSDIVSAAWASSQTCAAIATDTTVHVIDVSGAPLWTWNYHQTNRLIRLARWRQTLAVSPDCSTVALGGDTDYKYVWIANRQGRHRFVKTSGTPWAARFSQRGDVVAVTTGAAMGYVLSPDGTIRWSGGIGDLPITWPSEGDPPARTQGVFARDDVEMLFALPSMGGHVEAVSDDGEWLAVASWPFRGGDDPWQIEVWGPRAGGFRGLHTWKPAARWTKAIGCPGQPIPLDGGFVVITGDLTHTTGPDVELYCGETQSTYLFDQDGNLIWTGKPYLTRGELSDVIFQQTGARVALPARIEWDVPFLPQDYPPGGRWTDTHRRPYYSPDRQMLLMTLDKEVRLYRKPG